MNTRNLFILGLLGAAPLLMQGMPAFPGLLKVTNPDGSQSEVVRCGDERFSWYEDAGRSVVMEKGADGFWEPLQLDGRVLTTSESDLLLLRQKKAPASLFFSHDSRYPARMGSLDTTDGRTLYPTIGDDIHALVVLVEFSDVKFTVPNIREAIYKQCNEENYSDYDAVGSARDYFRACSDGKFAPIFDVTEVVTLPKTMAYYVNADHSAGPNIADEIGIITEGFAYAVNYLSESGQVDFSKYDYDKNGYIDNIYFYYAGYGQADQPANVPLTIWPHQDNFEKSTTDKGGRLDPVWVNGVKFGPYACSNELKGNLPEGAKQPYLAGIGAFVHEYGHVLGIPDFYGNTAGPGKMDVMAEGPYQRNSTQPPLFSAYEKWLCHWLEYEEAVDGTSYDLEALSKSNRAIRVSVKNPDTGNFYKHEYFLIETRATDGWDTSIPQHGLVVWHIAYNSYAWSSNSPNGSNVRYTIVRNPTGGYVYGIDHTYLHKGLNVLSLIDGKDDEFNPFLTSICFDDENTKATFDYNVITEVPSLTTTMHEEATRIDDPRSVVLSWDPVDGASSYLLSVYRLNSFNQPLYIDQCDKKDVGLATSWRVENFLTSVWYDTVYAYVTVSQGIPSTDHSNTISFIPADLPAGVAPNLADADIRVEGNSILAPEGAKVWNAGGVRVNPQGLPAGIYFVECGGKTVKVFVK